MYNDKKLLQFRFSLGKSRLFFNQDYTLNK